MAVTFEDAGSRDEERLLPFEQALYAHEELSWDDASNGAALRRLLADRTLGRVVMVVCDGTLAGFASVTWGYSTEFGGRFGLLDELYVDEAFRGRGLAREALAHVEEMARREGARALRLEVRPDNTPALDLYRRRRYEDQGRLFLTKSLEASAGRRAAETPGFQADSCSSPSISPK